MYYCTVDRVPAGLEDVSKYPALFAELIKRGYSDEDVMKISRLNLIRVFKDVEQVCYYCLYETSFVFSTGVTYYGVLSIGQSRVGRGIP